MEINTQTMPFTEYLNETYFKVEGEFSSLKWLESLDDDSFNMLYEYISNFDKPTTASPINDDEVVDMFQLVRKLASLETSVHISDVYSEGLFNKVHIFCILTTLEGLKRKGLVKLVGTGRITDEQTRFNLTELGKSVSSLSRHKTNTISTVLNLRKGSRQN